METKKVVSIVVPVYYNEKSLSELFSKLESLVPVNPNLAFEFIFVDDYSGDDSYRILSDYLKISKYNVKVLKLSKNHGSFTACLAGLSKATGDCAVIISADLQDPVEMISQMASEWKNGHEIVMAARSSREDPFLTKMFSGIYYAIFRKFALNDMPKGGFDFVLFDRKIINILCDIQEKNTSLMGLILWSGFNKKVLYYDRKQRKHGASRWTVSKKIKYFTDSFVAFSFAPIRFATSLGFIVSLIGFSYALFLIYDRIFNNHLVQGITTIIVLILFLGGIQLIVLGMLGEYLWRILDETRKRPTFIIDKYESSV